MDIREVIKLVGTQDKVAKICRLKTRQAVSLWTAVPLRHVAAISRATGVSPHDLRPDAFPKGCTVAMADHFGRALTPKMAKMPTKKKPSKRERPAAR